MQTLFEVVYIEVLFAIEHYKVVPVALVVSEKKILQCFEPSFLQCSFAIAIVGASGCS